MSDEPVVKRTRKSCENESTRAMAANSEATHEIDAVKIQDSEEDSSESSTLDDSTNTSGHSVECLESANMSLGSTAGSPPKTARNAIRDIITEFDLDNTIEILQALKYTTSSQSLVKSMEMKLINCVISLSELKIDGEEMDEIRLERDAVKFQAETALRTVEGLLKSSQSETSDQSSGDTTTSNVERFDQKDTKPTAFQLSQIPTVMSKEQREEKKRMLWDSVNEIQVDFIDPFDDVRSSCMHYIIVEQIQSAEKLAREGMDCGFMSHVEFSDITMALQTARRNLNKKAKRKEAFLRLLQEKCAALSRSRESMERMKQGLAYLERQVSKFHGTTEARGYRFLEDQLTGMMRNLDRMELKDDDEIRPLYEASIAEVQRVLQLLEQRAALPAEEREAESAETCMRELNCILDELNSIPDGGINEAQYQHLQYKVHTTSSELENLTEEVVTQDIRERAAKLVQEAYEKLELKLPKQQIGHASSSQVKYEGPLQLLLDDGKGGFRLDEEALRSVVCQESVRHRKLVVLSVVGEFRRGKSFLLNFMVRYLRTKCSADWLESTGQETLEGFTWRRDPDRVTTGILIWPEAFLVKKDFAVVLLDTQGTFDMESNMEQNTFIFALSTLVSSIQIVNIHERLQMDAFLNLQYFVEHGNIIAKESGKAAFQKLLILIRDWKYPDKYDFGIRGGQEYWSDNIQKQEEIASSIRKCYENIDCFLMPHPGEKVANSPEFRGALSDINEEFVKNLKTLIEHVLAPANLVAKRSGLMSSLNAEHLVIAMNTFINDLKSSDKKPDSLFQMTAKLHHEKEMATAVDFYTSNITKNLVKAADITKLHEETKKQALNRFKGEKLFGASQFKAEYVKILKTKLDAEYNRLVVPFLEEREHQRKNQLQTTLEDAIYSHRNALSNCVLGPDYHKFQEIDQKERGTANASFVKVTGYFSGMSLAKLKSRLLNNQSELQKQRVEYEDILKKFTRAAEETCSELFPKCKQKLKSYLDSVKNEACEIYRSGMRNDLKVPQGSKKFDTSHSNAQKAAIALLKKQTTHLKMKNDVEACEQQLNKALKGMKKEFSAQNSEKFRVSLEGCKLDAVASYDKEMGQWMREYKEACDMKKFNKKHDAAISRALSKFTSSNLDNKDDMYISFFAATKQAINEKMKDSKEIFQKTGMQQSVSLTVQKYMSAMEGYGAHTRYVGDLAAQHLKVEAEAIQSLNDLLDNSERSKEALGEAQKLISSMFATYNEVNNAKRSEHFFTIYKNFERTLKMELSTLQEAIRVSWQKDLEEKVDKILKECSQIVYKEEDESTEYTDLNEKATSYANKLKDELLRNNEEKRLEELEAMEKLFGNALNDYKSEMNAKIIGLTFIPDDAKVVEFHEPAKKVALDNLSRALDPYEKNHAMHSPAFMAKLLEYIQDALEALRIANNLRLREKRTREREAGCPVGIDLGTTYSCIAVYRNGQCERIKNSFDSYTTPSVIYYGPNEPCVGEAAVLKGQTDFRNCISGVKRIIGRRYGEYEVYKFRKGVFFNIVNRDGLPRIEIIKNGQKRCLKVEEVSAQVLREMKHQASRHLKYEVKDAVVTVPAYFTEPQRAATLEACRLADINVLRLLNEPTAAALAFGTQHQDKSLRRVLVFDFGGGTCDVSVLEVRGDDFVVKASRGDNTLGGRDLDQRLLEYVLKCPQLSEKSLDSSTKSRILYECEKVKRILSDKLEEKMYLAKVDGSELRLDITRAEFERISLDLLEKALIPVEDCLAAANLNKLQIDVIVLAGGSSHIPKMKELLTEFFGGKKLHEGINPDEAIAHGAALQAAIITKDPKLKTTIKEITPHSLGIRVQQNDYAIIIPKDSTIPCQHTQAFYTMYDNQKAINNKIFQGENSKANKNTFLGQFTLENIKVAPAGETEEHVTFTIDENGILHVEAQEVSDTKTNVESITINRKVI